MMSTLHNKFIELLGQVRQKIRRQDYCSAQKTIQQFSIRNSSTLFFQSPIIFYELLSLKGFLIAKLNRQSQALQFYNEVLKFNQFHYITLQRKQQLTGQKQEILLLLDNKDKDENQFDNMNGQQLQTLKANKSFSKLKSIDRIFQSPHQSKSVIFKKMQNLINHLDQQILNQKNLSNKQNQHTNQSESRNNQQSTKKKGILKRTSFQINIERDTYKNIQKWPFYLQLQKNSHTIKHHVKKFQKRPSFDANKIKNIEGKPLSKSNLIQLEKNKQVIFEIQQIFEKQNDAQKISIQQQRKKQSGSIKRKSSLIEQSKFHKIPKQIDLADLDQF